jgi:hypothetical protein
MRSRIPAFAALALCLAASPAPGAPLTITYQLTGGSFFTAAGGSQAVTGGTARLVMEATGPNTVASGALATLLSLTATGPGNRIRLVSPHRGFLLSYSGMAFRFGGHANVFQTGPGLSNSIPVFFSDSYVFRVMTGAPRFRFTAELGPITTGVVAGIDGTEVARSFAPEPGLPHLLGAGLVGLALAAAGRRALAAQPAR